MIRVYQNKHTSFNFGILIFFICLATLFFFPKPAKSSIVNNKNSCEKINGNYREYGNSCLDRCLPQFSKYQLCVNEAKYGCDCGRDKCFYQNKCLTKAKFKPIYKKFQTAEEAIDKDRLGKIISLMNTDPLYSKFIHNLFANYKDPKTEKLKSEAQLMSDRFKNEAVQYVQAQQQQQQQQKQSGKSNVANVIEVAAEKPGAAIPMQIPQFYIDNQEQDSSAKPVKLPLEQLNMIFPVVPLPGAAP